MDGVALWRCVGLEGVIADRFPVALSGRQAGRILNRQGYQHPQADEAAQTAFKKTFPRR